MSRVIVTVLAGLLCLTAGAGSAAADVMQVPGGRQAIERLLEFTEPDPARFTDTLNFVLLDAVRPDHDWRQVTRRVDLVDYLDTIRELERGLLVNVELAGTHDLQRRYKTLTDLLGYSVTFDDRGPILSSKAGEKWERRRRVARALDWDIARIGWRLMRDERVDLTLRTERVPAPLTFDVWSSLARETIDPANALARFARDQRIGLIAGALRGVSEETARRLTEPGILSWLHGQVPVAFYRYAPSLEIRDGRLRLPGGENSKALWQEIVGPSPEDIPAFLARLLGNERNAYLWQTLYFAPSARRAWALASMAAEPGSARRTPLLTTGEQLAGYGQARAEDVGLPSLLRAVPMNEDASALALPGGSGLWLAALDGAEMPRALSALEKKAAGFSKRTLTDEQFLRRTLASRVELEQVGRPAVRRLASVVRLYENRPELFTPENVILLTRAVDRYPLALRPLQRLELADPTSVRDYLLAVARLDALGHAPRKYLLISNFQGGVALLAALGRAGKLEPARLEASFRAWVGLHIDAADPLLVAPQQLDWLAELLVALPIAAPDAPGRGPRERALLAAMVPRRDPQRFSWRGMEYEGRRELDLARVMERHLTRQGVPSADALIRIRDELRTLREACDDVDVDRAGRSSAALLECFRALPPGRLDPPVEDDRLRPWFESIDRPEAERTLQRIAENDSVKRLPKMIRQVDRVGRMTARELRAFLLAPAYLEALDEFPALLFDEAKLIRKHTMIHSIDVTIPLTGDSPWEVARVVPAGMSPIGTRVTGHLAGVTAALAEFHFADARIEGDLTTLPQLRVWYEDYVDTPWRLLTPELTGRLADTIDSGERLLEVALEQLAVGSGTAMEIALTRLPRARMERMLRGEPGPVSLGELFLLGLDATTRAQSSPGDDPRRALHLAGARTPTIDGATIRAFGDPPPYEVLVAEGLIDGLIERQLLDLRLAVLRYVGREGLPGTVAADLMRMTLLDLARNLQIDTRFDYVSVIDEINAMDREYFDERMRECFAAGWYEPAGF